MFAAKDVELGLAAANRDALWLQAFLSIQH